MVWELERHGCRSTLIGAAHFFPRHFRRSLRRLLGEARIVLLEGPLDEEATRKVLAAGRGSGGSMLYEAAGEKINAQLGIVRPPLDLHQLLKDLVFGRQDEWLGEEMRALKPWAAFFGVWTRYRAREGWTHSLDLDAARIAAALGKQTLYLETIEEQIAALEAVPLERILGFMNVDWSAYCAAYERHYLAGELDALVAAAQAFPTYCEPIIERRDPLLAERMARELERGQACVVIGVAHCPGVLARLKELGYVNLPCP
ncbi:MAG TPA: TraB/GumN family protein [Burkholderiales bacterium]|nr:TraB/GumN family protein [Burkholderiales bacterium]